MLIHVRMPFDPKKYKPSLLIQGNVHHCNRRIKDVLVQVVPKLSRAGDGVNYYPVQFFKVFSQRVRCLSKRVLNLVIKHHLKRS